jgi:hypothetical protein
LASDQVKRVRVWLSAIPPGLSPLRTRSEGQSASRAIMNRVWPSPSSRQRTENPKTSRLARSAAHRSGKWGLATAIGPVHHGDAGSRWTR